MSPIPYSFELFWIWCSYLNLLRIIWWKTLPITFRRIWLVRPITPKNIRGQLYPYISGGFNYSSHSTAYLLTNNRSILSTVCGGYYNMYMFWRSVPECDTPPHDYRYMNIIRVSYIYVYITIVGLHISRGLGPINELIYKIYIVTWGVAHGKKMTWPCKTSRARTIWIYVKCCCAHPIIYLFPSFNIKT